jgi:hypothetical protein
MARYKMVNGERIQFTPEEEAARDAEEAQAIVEREAEEVAKIARQEKLDSTKSKLEALGLTTEEVKEAFGL